MNLDGSWDISPDGKRYMSGANAGTAHPVGSPQNVNAIDLESPTANMFGIEPCPKCGSIWRWPGITVKGEEMIRCDDCLSEWRMEKK